MERRMLLAIVLSFLAISGYSALMRSMHPPVKKDSASPDGANSAEEHPNGKNANGTNDDSNDNSNGNSKNGTSSEEPGIQDPKGARNNDPVVADDTGHPQTGAPDVRVKLTSDELEVGFTSLGGAVEYVRLRNALEADQKTNLDLVLPMDRTMLIGQLDDITSNAPIAPGGADRKEAAPGPLRRLNWTRDTAAEDRTKEDDIVFTFDTGKGVVLKKQWLLGQGAKRYDITLRIEAREKGEGGSEAAGDGEYSVNMLVASQQYREVFKGAFATPSSIVKRTSDAADVEDAHMPGHEFVALETRGTNPDRLRVLGSKSHYFGVLYYGNERGDREPPISGFWATGEEGAKRGAYEEEVIRFMKEERGREIVGLDRYETKRVRPGTESLHHAWVRLALPVYGAKERGKPPTELNIFAGPLARDVLSQDAYSDSMGSVITYPSAFDFVAKFLLWIYDFWRNLFGSAGVGVILMTLCVRGAMMPISIKNQLSMRRYSKKVAKLKPKVAALQERFPKNPKKLREEQMKLYREHGVGFPTGCLMMLIQIPIFFALFSALRVEYTLRGAPFLWISDLSGPDKLIDFGGSVLNLGILDIRSLNILPLIMVALSLWHTRSMPVPADEQQAQQMKMMKWLPIVFAVILYNYTAALALYMVLSSAFAIIESKVVRAKDEADNNEEGDLSAFPAKA